MEYNEDTWEEAVLRVSKHFKVTADFDFMLFVIGIQARGTGFKSYSRDEKWDLINLGKCLMLEESGYLRQSGEDQEEWPVFEEIKSVKGLSPSFQKHLLKKSMTEYFSKVLI
jgi:hypothetical protein